MSQSPTVELYHGDLPQGRFGGRPVAIDTETLGLNPFRDRLCLVQLSEGDGRAVPVGGAVVDFEDAHATRTACGPGGCGTSGRLAGLRAMQFDLGCRLTEGEPELLHARSHVLLAARAAGLAAYDSPHFVIADLEGLRRASQAARNLGYDGKTVIHPSHIATVNEIFAPTAEEIDEARRVVAALEEAAREGRGAILLDGRLVDQVHLSHARKILSRVDD